MLHYRTCNLCEAMCGLAIESKDGRVQSIRGDDDDPFSKGHICPKAAALGDLHEDPDRLRQPQRRTATGWESVGWDEAFRDIATRIRAVQKKHGRDSVAFYAGNPVVHNYGALLFAPVLLGALLTRSRFSANSVDTWPHFVASHALFGHQLLLPVPDLDRTSFLLMLGANPAVSNGSVMSAPGVKQRLKDIRARGGRVVVVDPRRTETADLANQHHFIRPGTDAWLLAAMIHTLFEESRVRPGRLMTFVDGLEQLQAAVRPFTAESASGVTGIPAEDIRVLARAFADAPAAACYGRLGICTQQYGALNAWLINVLNIVTGNLDRAGGMMFTRPAVDPLTLTALLGAGGSLGKMHTRVRGLPDVGGEFPVAALAEEIETPGRGQLRALITLAGNPVLSAPNGTHLDRALPTLDLMVAIDCYRNETTRHAHYILPPVSPLERDHFDLTFNLLSVRNVVKYSPPLFPPREGARDDWEILRDLASALLPLRVPRAVTPRRLVDVAMRTGSHRLSLAQVERAPHGLDLGALEPALPQRLRTKNHRIHLLPAVMKTELSRLQARSTAPVLQLIGRRGLRSNNSWLHNVERLTRGPDQCTLLMNPGDGAARGLANGARVKVTSKKGSVEVALELSDEVMAGVVSLPHGWGHARAGVNLNVAARHPGVSINDLTDDTLLDGLSGTAAFSGVPVDVTAV